MGREKEKEKTIRGASRYYCFVLYERRENVIYHCTKLKLDVLS